jgi:DNA-binding response OmpR family regulator
LIGPHVLVVEDEPSIQETLARLLYLHGFDPLTASDFSEAVTIAEAQAIAAVVLDLTLRGSSSGLDVLAWLRGRPEYVNTPVLILTGALSLDEFDEAVIRRHRAYVYYKPQNYGALIDDIRRLIGDRRCP